MDEFDSTLDCGVSQACGNTTPDLPDSVRESAGQAMFQDLLVHGQVKK